MPPLKLHTGQVIDIFSAETETELELPFLGTGISAGFPSPALDFVDLSIDLNKHLIKMRMHLANSDSYSDHMSRFPLQLFNPWPPSVILLSAPPAIVGFDSEIHLANQR